MKTLVTILLVLLASPAFAERAGGGSDHDRARSAVEREEILPLSRIVPGLQQRYGGRVIKLELETEDGRYLYELKLITPQGRIIEVEVDAATGLPIGETGEGERDEDD